MKEGKCYPRFFQAIWLLLLLILLQGLFSGILGYSRVGLPLVLGLVNLVTFTLVLLWGHRKTAESWKEVFSFQSVPTLLFIPMFLVVIGMGVLLSEIDNLFRTVVPMPMVFAQLFSDLLMKHSGQWDTILLLVGVAPVTEELLFRGLILHGFLGNYSVKKAILASSILFGLIHFNPWQLMSATLMGAMFAWWYVRTRSLVPCLLGHALINALPTFVMCGLHWEIRGLTYPAPPAVAFQPLWLDCTGVVLTLSGLLLLRSMFRSAYPQTVTAIDEG